MTEGYKELLKLAKRIKPATTDELMDLISECSNEITGADFESVRKAMKIKLF